MGAISSVSYVSVFNQKYSPKKDGTIAKLKCGVCHQKQLPKLNAYGEDLAKVTAGAKKLTNEMLAKIEDKDSDGDGVKNLAELKADTNPGDKASK